MLNPVTATKNKVVANKTKILITALVATTAYAALLKAGLAQHNEFLKQHDLYDAFYTIVE